MAAAGTTYSRYLPVSDEAVRWETHCLDAGYSLVPPGASYPLAPWDHPTRYGARAVADGRVLAEFQVVYITQGSGIFRAEEFGEADVVAGDVFLLFPGIKHAYHPNPETGWHEYWVGFAGEHPQRLRQKGIIRPEQAVRHVGLSQEITADFEQIIRLCRQQPPAFQVRLGAHVLQLLAHVHAACVSAQTSPHEARPVDVAREMIESRMDEGIDVKDLAGELGMSYPALLKIFRIHTGMTPYQYFLQLQVHRAKALLQDPTRTIKQVSSLLNFDNQYYFSRIFKKKTGYSPSAWKSMMHAQPMSVSNRYTVAAREGERS